MTRELAVHFLHLRHQILWEKSGSYIRTSQFSLTAPSDSGIRVQHPYHNASDLPLNEPLSTRDLGMIPRRTRFQCGVYGSPSHSLIRQFLFQSDEFCMVS